MDPLTLLGAVAPILGRLANAAINRWIAPSEFKPATIDEAVRLSELRIKEFQALNAAGAEGETYPWVNAIIRLQRPAVVVGVLLFAGWQIVTLGSITEPMQNALGVIGAYLFMDRTLFHLRGKP